MTSRNIRGRLERLEKWHNGPSAERVPPLFWEAICGTVPLDQLDPDTHRLIAPLFDDSRDAPGTIEHAPGRWDQELIDAARDPRSPVTSNGWRSRRR
jgi:hypothetical protein